MALPYLISLNESTRFRYIYINPKTNRVHLLVPFIAGMEVSTDNTCKSGVELKAFFEGGAFNELESYKSTLEFHLSLLEESDAHYRVKKERLAQINLYLEAVVGMEDSYKTIVNSFLLKPSNLYSIQLRPSEQDSWSRVVNSVFTINRENDYRGTPLSSLYNKMHEVFLHVVLGKPDPRAALIQKVLKALPSNASFKIIQQVLATQYGVPHGFFKKRTDANRQEQIVDKTYVDGLMGFDAHTTPHEYIEALLGICAPNLQSTLEGSPFYFESSSIPSEKAERLSILTQFYLGVLNVYCRSKGISDQNFGLILDDSPALSQELVDVVAVALGRGEKVEALIFAFFNRHQNEFRLSRKLNSEDKKVIVQKFETTYRTVTATKENPHMDDFMFLDTEAQGEHDIFITHKGLICTDAANIIPTTPQNQDYLAEIRHEARLHRAIITPQDERPIRIKINLVTLIGIDDAQLEKLPKEVVKACRALPAFKKTRQFWNDVAKGKQDEVHALLTSSKYKQDLLRTSGKFTDYSGRTFHCTAYEYAYWAKDKHMMRMLERHMNDKTKAFMLKRIEVMEQVGLAYQQQGISYQNAHYDMSFVLKNFTADEFRQLQSMVGKRSEKIQQATAENYKTISFTVIEYEALKKILCPKDFFSFFSSSSATALSEKLQFDFHSLITALDSYVTHFDEWTVRQRREAWMKVGIAQRHAPAHVVLEYYRPDRSFYPLPFFTEKALPRILTIKPWFPLTSSSLGLGFSFALIRGDARWVEQIFHAPTAQEVLNDLAAVRYLDEVRNADLTQSRKNLSRTASQLRLGC